MIRIKSQQKNGYLNARARGLLVVIANAMRVRVVPVPVVSRCCRKNS